MSIRKISIITPSLNRVGLIESAIRSVIAQGYPAYEHIIIDGGSTDGTEQVVRKYPGTRFLSGHDLGMYDALNKGLGIASGEIIGFLNTDDLYAGNFFSLMATEFDDADVMAVAGRAIVFAELPGGQTRIVDQYSPEDMSLIECSTIGSNYFNAWFFRRQTFERIGRFNADFKIVGDRDFMLRFALNNLKYAVIGHLVYEYRSHPESFTFDKDARKREQSAREHLVMTDIYLSDPALSGLARKLLIRLRTSETVDLAARSIWKGRITSFYHYFSEGLSYDLAWPLRFLQFCFNRGLALFFTRQSARGIH